VSLVRTGTLLAGVGLTVSLLWAVAFGPTLGCTEMACPGAPTVYSVASVSLVPIRVGVADGCNVCTVAPPVVYGALAAVAGVVVGSVGQVRRASVA
jgi:hypothetical protein